MELQITFVSCNQTCQQHKHTPTYTYTYRLRMMMHLQWWWCSPAELLLHIMEIMQTNFIVFTWAFGYMCVSGILELRLQALRKQRRLCYLHVNSSSPASFFFFLLVLQIVNLHDSSSPALSSSSSSCVANWQQILKFLANSNSEN